MQKMKCPKCQKMIVSALLAELDTIFCEHCQTTVPVNDVLVCAEGFTFHRSDLIKRLFRYKTLLNEVSLEKEMLEKNASASEESKKSLDRFLHALDEVMAGARNNLRLDFTESVPVLLSSDSQTQPALLSNLSMTGARIEIPLRSLSLRKKGIVSLKFSLPGQDENYELTGIVTWINSEKSKKPNSCAVGIEFEPLNQQVSAALWSFISSSVTTDID